MSLENKYYFSFRALCVFFGDMDFSRRLYIPLKAELEVSDRSWDAESLRNSTTKATEYGRLKIE